jgi:hypothetical protein
MRSRLGTGKHLDETFLMLPSAVPTAHGITPQQSPAGPVGGQPFATPSTGGAGDVNSTGIPGGLFGGAAPTGGSRTALSSGGPTSALNLMGKLESWSVGPATPVHQVRVRLGAATGAQLQKLLKGLPDGLTYELDLEREDGAS